MTNHWVSIATYFNELQRTATHCNALQRTAMQRCNILQTPSKHHNTHTIEQKEIKTPQYPYNRGKRAGERYEVRERETHNV